MKYRNIILLFITIKCNCIFLCTKDEMFDVQKGT